MKTTLAIVLLIIAAGCMHFMYIFQGMKTVNYQVTDLERYRDSLAKK